MRFFSYTLGILGLFCLTLPILAVFALLDETADNPVNPPASALDAERMQGIVLKNGPGLLGNDSNLRIELNEDESNALINYLSRQGQGTFQQWLEGMGARLELVPDRAILHGTLAFSPSLLGQYLNFSAHFAVSDNRLKLEKLQLADFEVPAFVYLRLLKTAEQALSSEPNFQLATSILDAVNQIELSDRRVSFSLDWESERLGRLQALARQVLIEPMTAERLLSYQGILLDTLRAMPASQNSASLTALLTPLFAHAAETADNPQEENQAIFVILTCYLLSELTLEDLLGPRASNQEAAPRVRITLESRDDLPRHLVASAAIAAYANDELANILAVFKEVQDSRTDSGFSFSDMTANRVGTRLGMLSADSVQAAVYLQQFFAQVQDEQAYMPLVGRPDGISEAEFIQRYGSRNSDSYLQKLDEIEAEIEKLSVFQSIE